MSKFKDRLSESGILITDGATGTVLQRAGLPSGTAPERWNLENQEAIRELHRGYVEAGSDLILTNTFGGSRPRLEMEGLGDKVREINLAAARLAREIAGDEVMVLGDIGPSGQLLEPMGTMTYDDAVAAFAEQAAALAEGLALLGLPPLSPPRHLGTKRLATDDGQGRRRSAGQSRPWGDDQRDQGGNRCGITKLTQNLNRGHLGFKDGDLQMVPEALDDALVSGFASVIA